MLTSTGFGDYLLLAHALCQKSLSQSIVNLVGASVKQILPLEINFGSTVVLGELICIIQKGRTASVLHIVFTQIFQEFWISSIFFVGLLQLVQYRHYDFWYILSAEFAKSALFILYCHDNILRLF